VSIADLKLQIEARTARLAVIGLGYVGLPIACAFAEAGFQVVGIEQRQERVESIQAGISPIEGDEPGLAELLAGVIASGKLQATIDPAALSDAQVILICVETPVDDNRQPRYTALIRALKNLEGIIQDSEPVTRLVIIESTLAPGTMQQVVAPILQVGNQGTVHIGHCPERVMPGKLLANLRHSSRVVGGDHPETAQTMAALYRTVVQADLDPTDCLTAELVKTVENSYRDIQIAFANEIALVCEAVGGDVWQVRSLVNKSPFRQMHLPGAGVGGHCIPKDPWLLAAGYPAGGDWPPLRLIPAARQINDGMPLHMAELARQALETAGLEMANARLLVLGVAYLEDSDDTRNSPTFPLVDRLRSWGAEVHLHDPFVTEFQGDLLEMAGGCDEVIVMVRHAAYQGLYLPALKAALKHPILIDGRHVFDRQALQAAGWIYRGIGQA
jgi:UDP-N-acetyl-D-mannosaminuronic acid dehydrogenase